MCDDVPVALGRVHHISWLLRVRVLCRAPSAGLSSCLTAHAAGGLLAAACRASHFRAAPRHCRPGPQEEGPEVGGRASEELQ